MLANEKNEHSSSHSCRNPTRINHFTLPQFFEETNLTVRNQYNYEDNMKLIETLPEEYLLYSHENFFKKEDDIYDNEGKVSIYLENVYFLTEKKEDDTESELHMIELIDFAKYMRSDTKVELNLLNNEEKKEITIKFFVDFDKVSENMIKNFCEKSSFEQMKISMNEVVHSWSKKQCDDGENINEENIFKNQKSAELDLEIKLNSVKKIYETKDDNIFIFELYHPPAYKTNFMKVPDITCRSEFQYCVSPFRNFSNEIANLKFKKLYLLLKGQSLFNQTLNKNIQFLSNNDNVKSLKTLLKPLEKAKFDRVDWTISTEADLRKSKHMSTKELNEYFAYDNTTIPIINEKFFQLGLININENGEEEDIHFIGFFYQILALVSENIISYFNAIEFVENFLFPEIRKCDYSSSIFGGVGVNPLFLNEALTKMLDHLQNSGREFTLVQFEERLKSYYNEVKLDFAKGGEEYVKKRARKRFLLRSQRILVTPTFTLFMPYIEDQGNRILRDHLSNTLLGMRCVFKMDDFEEARWNNRFLMEFIKYYLDNGVQLGGKSYKFFCYSQSQFRNMSCWLVVDPESLLRSTGDYSNIKIPAKFGARIGQTLTTTIKTIVIPQSSIKYIDDVIVPDENGRARYIFSDGVGTITYDFAKRIADILLLKEVPSAFQGRFLGCKGVWTVLFHDNSSEIKIRPSQKKFDKKITTSQYFEVCGYSKFIKAYLNRQVILLLSALKIPDEVFLQKLEEYRNSLEDEKFILTLIHYEEWNGIFNQMYMSGINMTNDRLIKSLVGSNKEILYRDLRKRARIYMEKGAYVMGIMDEFGVLEYGEAFCRVVVGNLDITLDNALPVAKCPCLHPGDIRKLHFRGYTPDDPSSLKYKALHDYKNVIIFPQNGKRPHPNELSGSDLDGDMYFIFYDKDLTTFTPVEPMDYSDSTKQELKDSISLKDIIEFFAEYVNTNNLGLIADAHLSHADQDPKGADGELPRTLAIKFSRAVDAPKTGAKIVLEEREEAKKYPHYMEKRAKSFHSNHVLGKLYDKTIQYLEEISRQGVDNHTWYDPCLILPGWDNFLFEALIYYKDYYEEILAMMKKNEIKNESELLTGNNLDNESGSFAKKKHNYDIIDRISVQMISLFEEYQQKFYHSEKSIFGDEVKINEYVFTNSMHCRASAFYLAAYDFFRIITQKMTNEEQINEYTCKFTEKIVQSVIQRNNNTDRYQLINYAMDDEDEIFIENDSMCKTMEQIAIITEKIEKWKAILIHFLREKTKYFDIPKNPKDENQYRILSFPWCSAGKILVKIRQLLQ